MNANKARYNQLMSELEELKGKQRDWRKSNPEILEKRQAAKEYPIDQDFPGFARMEEIEKELMSPEMYDGALRSGSIKFGNDE